MLEAALTALATLVSPLHLVYLGAGVFLGLVVGILPGLGGTAGLALVLPFLFGMDPSLALAMMIGLQSVTATSDTFPSVLMGIPGTSGSQATVMDGFPMSKKGEGTRALSAAFVSSMFGGIFGALILSGAILVAIPLILAVGFGEQMMLIILALTMVGMLTGPNPFKGLAACAMGLMLGSAGSAPFTGVVRMGFETDYMLDKLPLVIVGLAMFATPEIVDLLRRRQTISDRGVLGQGWAKGAHDWWVNKWLSLRCAIIGCVVGALPGLGGTVIDWIAYGHAMQTTPNKERYGTGDVRGVIAPESANNAKEGGALIPTLLFGIPGSGSMAILLGGFVLIGIEPGINMVRNDLDLIYLMIWSVGLANIIGAGTCFLLAPQISKLTAIKYALLAPFMLGLIFFAAFQATRDWADLLVLFGLSILGIYMKRFGWPRPALLIGFVLSNKVEELVYQTFTVYGLSFLERPVVIVLGIMIILSIIAVIRFKPEPPDLTVEGVHSNRALGPQTFFYLLILAATLYLIYDATQYQFLTALFPYFAAGMALVFLVPLGIKMLRAKGQPSIHFYDGERRAAADNLSPVGEMHYLLWLLGMLGVSAVFGFVIGVATFIFAFLRVKAEISYVKAAIGAIAFVVFLGILSNQLTLEYPKGYLQWGLGVTLPWPLQ